MDRRDFLKISAYASGGLLISWDLPGESYEVRQTQLNPYLLIAEDNSIKIVLSLKDHPRHLAVLNLAAEKAGWDKPLAAGLFRGIAIHEAMGSCISQVVEIKIENKKIEVKRVVCVIDCGLAVNPDGVIAQMEGSIIFGLTAALYGEITVEQGQVKQSNFHDYRMLRMSEAPVIEVYIVPGGEKMGGAGEPGVPPVAPALANAIFAATGKRLRNLPLRL